MRESVKGFLTTALTIGVPLSALFLSVVVLQPNPYLGTM